MFADINPVFAAESDSVSGQYVAPKVEDTLMQTWPSAAWSGKANCWLVAWREGDMTGQNTDIWCARVGADGKTLDPEGIRVCTVKESQDRPCVVSDGNGFIVVWEDLRNGKDWDIYAARVTGEGKVLDEDGVLVAGGEHNQCRPAAVFHQDRYLVVFMGFTTTKGGRPDRRGTGYVVRSVRLSPECKPLDAEPTAVSDPKPRFHNWQPCAAASAEGVVVGVYQREFGRDSNRVFLGSGWVAMPDGKVGTPIAKVLSSYPKPYHSMACDSRTTHQPTAAVWTGKVYLMAMPKGEGRKWRPPDDVAVFRLDPQGKDLGNPEIVGSFGGHRILKNPRISITFDGERVLLLEDSVRAKDSRGEGLARMQVRGAFLSPEGKPLKEGIFIAGDNKMRKDCMQGFAAAGPRGEFLAVWSEARGIDDVRIAGRVVK
jgi:hypothetical protein